MTDHNRASGGAHVHARRAGTNRGERSPTVAPWEPMPSRDWRAARTQLAAMDAAWPEALIRHDLRWWASRVRCGLDKGIPSARSLAQEWGVGRSVARRIMRDTEGWEDPRFHRPNIDPAPTHPRPTIDPPEVQQDANPDDDRPTIDPPSTHHRPTTGHTRGVSQPQSTEHKKSLSTSADTEPDRPALKATWDAIQAIRKEHNPGSRGQAWTPKRRRDLSARMTELRGAGFTADDLLTAVWWVLTSDNFRAKGAQNTGTPVHTLLRPKNCLEYVELALAEASGVTTTSTTKPDGAPQAWQHILTFTQRGELADRIRSGRLGPDPNEHGRRLAAVKAAGGFPAFRMLDQFTERRVRDAFLSAYDGVAA